MADWKDYLKLMEGLSHTLEQLTQVERDKNDAVSRGDLPEVEECMKREQVLSLSLRGCDQKREKLLSQMGLEGLTLSRLEENSPPELLLETKRVAEELRRQYALFRSASDVTRNTLEINLRAIERMQAVQAGDAGVAEDRRKNHQTDFRA